MWDGGEWKKLAHACDIGYCSSQSKMQCRHQYHNHNPIWGNRWVVRSNQPPLGENHWNTCSGYHCTEFCKHQCRACGGELPPPPCAETDPRCQADSEEKQRHICKHYGHKCQVSCDLAAQKGWCRKVRDAVPTCHDVMLISENDPFTTFCSEAVLHHTWRQSLGDETGGPTCSDFWQVCQVTCPKAAANGLCTSPTLLQHVSDTAFAIPEGPRSLPTDLTLAEATKGGNKDLKAQVKALKKDGEHTL